MTSQDSSVYLQNAESKAANWGKRAQVLADRAIKSGADFVAFQELYKSQAGQMDTLLATRYVRAAYRGGRVLYYRPDRWKPVGSGVWKNMRNGKSKPAVGCKFEHVDTGLRLNVINVHLSWEVNDAGRKKRRNETRNILAWDAKKFPKDRSLLVGDWNSPAGATNRPDDSGPIMFAHGYHDLGVAAGTKLGRGHYHIDRVFGSRKRMKATKISIDHHKASDHPGVFVKFTFTV
jgi:endonuclease/exonuclease/phosphatase (EEP) superfamily protein YafD